MKKTLLIILLCMALFSFNVAGLTLEDNLLSYYKADDATIAGNGTMLDNEAKHNCEDEATAYSGISGALNEAVGSGANGGYNCGQVPLDPNGGNYTLNFWANITSTAPADIGLFGLGSGSPRIVGYYHRGLDRLIIESRQSAATELNYNADLEDNQWHMITIVVSSATNASLWVNGTLIDTDAQSQWDQSSNSGDFHWATERQNNQYYGMTDEMGIWQRALEGPEIVSLYNSGTPLARADFGGNTPPTVAWAAEFPPDGHSFGGGDISFWFTATDDTTDPLTCYLTKDGAIENSSTPASGANTTLTGNLPSPADYNMTVFCDDGSFNSTSGDKNISVINNAPVIDWDNENLNDGYAINESSNVYYFFNCTDTDGGTLSAHVSLDGTIKNSTYGFAVGTNNSLSFSSGSLSEGNHTVQLLCDDGTVNVTSNKVLRWDTTPPDIPLIEQAFPLGTNASVAPNNRNVPFNISCGDNGLLWSLEINATMPNGTKSWGFYQENIQQSNYTYDTPVNLYSFGYPNGTITTDITCYDSHTADWIEDYYTEEDLGDGSLRYGTAEGNTIIVQLQNPFTSGLTSMRTEKKFDRYSFEYDLGNFDGATAKDFKFYVYSNNRLEYFKNSRYDAHFVVMGENGGNWLDFELDGKTEKAKVKKLTDNLYEVTVKTKQKVLKFNSVGALNVARNSAQFRLGNNAPSTPTALNPNNQSLHDTNQVNISCQGSTDTEGDTITYNYYTGSGTDPQTKTCDSIQGDCFYNATINGLLYWKCEANDSFAVSSNTSLRNFRAETWDIINFTEDVPTAGFEGENVVFTANMSFNEIRYSGISVNLRYNNSNYAVTVDRQATNNTELTSTVSLDDVILIANHTYEWQINLTYSNGTIYNNNSYNGSVEVSPIYAFEGCVGNSSDGLAYNFSFWDENDFTELSGTQNDSRVSFDTTIAFYKDDVNINYTFTDSVDNITKYELCIPQGESFKAIGKIDYIRSGYDRRQFYFTGQENLNNQTVNQSLYLLGISLATGTEVTFETSAGIPENDAYVYVYKENVGTGKFELVSMGLTDDDGKEFFFLQHESVFYRFELWRDGEILFFDTPSRKVTDTEFKIRTDQITVVDELQNVENIAYSLTNTSSTVVFTYVDSGDSIGTYCLSVYRTNSTTDQYVCQDCSSSASDTITCSIGLNQGVYISTAWASTVQDSSRPIATLILERTTHLLAGLGKTGLFASFLLILTMGTIGVYLRKVSTVVIMTCLSLVVCKMLGLLLISYPVLIGIIATGVIIAVWSKS